MIIHLQNSKPVFILAQNQFVMPLTALIIAAFSFNYHYPLPALPFGEADSLPIEDFSRMDC